MKKQIIFKEISRRVAVKQFIEETAWKVFLFSVRETNRKTTFEFLIEFER